MDVDTIYSMELLNLDIRFDSIGVNSCMKSTMHKMIDPQNGKVR